MTRNVGPLDRVLRVELGLALLSRLFVRAGGARRFGLIGHVPLATALAGSCPAYRQFGNRTCRLKGQDA
jgi:hypothetical protein